MDLERLIATEQRNEALVAGARAQADALLAAARAKVAADEQALRTSIDDAVRVAEAALAAERDRRVAEIAAEGRAAAARYDALDEARIAAVVPRLVEQLLAEEEV